MNSIWVMDVNCNVTLSYSHKLLYRNNDLMSIQVLGYGESLVTNLGACTIANDTGNKQRPQIAACRVTGTWGFLILGRETAQNVGYIHFLEVTPPTSTSMSQINTNVNALRPNSGAVQGFRGSTRTTSAQGSTGKEEHSLYRRSGKIMQLRNY